MTSNPAKMTRPYKHRYKIFTRGKKAPLLMNTDTGITTDESIVTEILTEYIVIHKYQS